MAALLAVAAFLFLIFGHRLGLHMGPSFGSKGPSRSSRTPGQKSEVHTEALKMDLDHDSGHMEGRCLKGQFAGRALSSLSHNELLQLLEELRERDPQGALLIEAYLDRRSQGWREQNSNTDAREEPKRYREPRGRMTAKEAYDVLGLETVARGDEIRAAHRRLMMKLHPDQGGSTYLASRINEAKEVLVEAQMNANGGTPPRAKRPAKARQTASSRHPVAIFKLCSNSGSCHFEPSPKIASDGAPASIPSRGSSVAFRRNSEECGHPPRWKSSRSLFLHRRPPVIASPDVHKPR